LSANGFRYLERNNKASVNTPFHIVSVSKTVTNLAIFKLVVSDKIDLNADINTYVPFEIQNPHYPNDIISARDLLNHRYYGCHQKKAIIVFTNSEYNNTHLYKSIEMTMSRE
jgi:hypothetical protein